jgi:hypothetical protein
VRSRRQPVSFWFCLRGAQRVSRVAAQLASVSERQSSGGNVQAGRPASSVVFASRGAPRSSREQDSESRNAAASKPVQVRESSSKLWQRSIWDFRSSWRSRASSSSSAATRFFSASRSARSISRASCSASRCRMSVHAVVHNTFNIQRHLVSRATLRALRGEALQNWRAATAA